VDDLLPEFVAETRETLQSVTGTLVAWEAAPDDRELLDQIFRFVHTVKGSCGFLDLPRLQRLSHAAEDALAEVRDGKRRAEPALVSAVLAVIDRIGELAEAIETGDAVSDTDEPRLVAALASVQAPMAAPVAPAVRSAASRPAARSVRLPVELLDRMMGSVSDMVLARNELCRELGGDVGEASGGGAAFERLSLCVRELREAVQRARMARIDTLFAALPRLVRDLSAELGKTVRLEVDGGEVELDREMIEMIRDPLTHIVRNAIDHGLEARANRLASGKAAEGRLVVCARQSGNRIQISIADDGAGIDAARVGERAVAAGLFTAAELAALEPARLLDLIFTPGLSTARAVTEISGRGVGMDIVRANVERLGGTVQVQSMPGQGTLLLLEVPLTLSIIPALTVGVGDRLFAVARTSIDEIVRTGGAVRLERVGGALLAEVRGQKLPVAELGPVMALPADPVPPLLMVVRLAGGGRFAIGLSTVHDHQELVIKPAAPVVMASGLFAGTTLPDNSRPLLLLDVAGIARAAGVCPALPVEAAPPMARPTLPMLLFRDLDGVERGVRLAEVERIEEVGRDAVLVSGGRHLLVHNGALKPLRVAGPVPSGARLRVVGLRGGAGQGVLVESVLDVVEAGLDLLPLPGAGPVAGILLHEGRPVELMEADRFPAGPSALPAADIQAQAA
jgi:two-component system chemotaxis sensor kinase CheA